jgi:hypothetical protein
VKDGNEFWTLAAGGCDVPVLIHHGFQPSRRRIVQSSSVGGNRRPLRPRKTTKWKRMPPVQSKPLADVFLDCFHPTTPPAIPSLSSAPSQYRDRAMSAAYSRVRPTHDAPDFPRILNTRQTDQSGGTRARLQTSGHHI